MNGTVQIPLQIFYTAHSRNKTLAWELCSCAHYLLRTDGQQYNYNQALNKQIAYFPFPIYYYHQQQLALYGSSFKQQLGSIRKQNWLCGFMLLNIV